MAERIKTTNYARHVMMKPRWKRRQQFNRFLSLVVAKSGHEGKAIIAVMDTGIFRGLIIAMLTLLFGAGSIIFPAEHAYADVKIEKSGWGPPVGAAFYFGAFEIYISKTISENDLNYIAQHEADFETKSLSVYLDSAGGSVDAALKIGLIIRKYEALVQVPKGATCFSSCALLYIAGVQRLNYGAIGLHRPYFASAPQSRQSIEREAPLMLQKLKDYVQEMGVTDIFYQEMVNTEPSAIKLYVGDNIKKMVPEFDPTYEEVETSYEARKYGVDTAEERRRLAEAEKCLDPYFLTCTEAIKWGLSERVYKDRDEKTAQCKLSGEEEKALKFAKQKEIRDQPQYLKWEACVRKIMLGR